MHTIKRTRERRYPLLLKAEHEDAGPYLLVDRAGFGVSWRRPSYAEGLGRTWKPAFYRALLAFTLVNEDDDVTPKEAKAIADKTYNHLGRNVDPAKAERYAWYLLDKSRRRK